MKQNLFSLKILIFIILYTNLNGDDIKNEILKTENEIKKLNIHLNNLKSKISNSDDPPKNVQINIRPNKILWDKYKNVKSDIINDDLISAKKKIWEIINTELKNAEKDHKLLCRCYFWLGEIHYNEFLKTKTMPKIDNKAPQFYYAKSYDHFKKSNYAKNNHGENALYRLGFCLAYIDFKKALSIVNYIKNNQSIKNNSVLNLSKLESHIKTQMAKTIV